MNETASPTKAGSLQQPTMIPESPPLAPTNMQDGQIPRASLGKYTPSPAHPSSTTPPPSSQVPQLTKHVLRTPSPSTSQLTSPPPTNRPVVYQHISPRVNNEANDLPSPEKISRASVKDLRDMVENLSISLHQSRADAAHYKLQHKLLALDTSEATNRMEVELRLTQREVEVLQEAEERRRQDYISPAQQAGNAALIEDLNRHTQILQTENEQLRDMLARTTRTLEDTDGVTAALREENQRLRHRIRTNRVHMNELLDSVSDGSPQSLMGTPSRHSYHTTPRHQPISRMMPTSGREPGAFDALLLADRVLNSQETATAPSTPKTVPLKHRMGHTRNTHSLSSLPSTPTRRPLLPTGASVLRTPPHLTTIMEPASVGQTLPPHFALPGSSTRRRASSDSTITASSVDEEEQKDRLDDSEDNIPESQASQRAANMLRHTPSSSQQSNKAAKLTQSRITGRVTKPGAGSESEKRRMASFGPDQGSPSKRGRIGGSGVGLGIGL